MVASVLVNLAKRSTVRGASVWGCRHLAVAQRSLLHSPDGRARHRVGCGKFSADSAFNTLFDPPFSESALVEVQPVLLRTNNHAGSHETHKGNDFVRCEAVAVDEIGANEAACATKTGLAVRSEEHTSELQSHS